jgi:3'(2'), 5'-bisphosphate nucleotidase
VTDIDLLEALIDPVRAACRVIQSVRAKGVHARTKDDKSPVTEADEAAEIIIHAALQKLTPHSPIVGEEAFAAGLAPGTCGDTFWLVDPVDGTKEFIRGGDDYTCNIGLVRGHQAQLGIVATPANGRIWLGGANLGAWLIEPNGTRRTISVRPRATPAVVVMSASHLDPQTKAFIETLGPTESIQMGSSLKLCVVAEGRADLYPRFAPTCEWDIAAGHAVLRGAGGQLTNPDKTGFQYGKPAFKNGAFIAWGG